MAVDFTPATDYLKVAAHADFAGNTGATDLPHSFAFWMVVDNLAADRYVCGAWDVVNQYFVRIHSTGRLDFYHFDTGTAKYLYIYTAVGSIVTGTRYHCAVSYDGSEDASGLKAYINATSTGTAVEQAGYAGMQSSSGNPFCIGDRDTGNAGFDGYLEDFRAWGSVIGAKDVSALVAGYRGPIGGEIGWWDLQLARGAYTGALSQGTHIFNDLAGNGHDADPYGSPSLAASEFPRMGVAI
jgi:hypothetical protein